MEEITYQGLTFEPYIRREEIAKQVHRLAEEVKRDYEGKCPLFLCILNGAFIFAADLFRACDLHDAEIAFIRFKSYQGMESTGEVKQLMGLTDDITGRHVLIVEDIIDTGTTMKLVVPQFYYKGAKDVKIATLLRKPSNLRYPDLKVDYCGMDVADKFLVGYGLDYDEEGRWLRDIYEMV